MARGKFKLTAPVDYTKNVVQNLDFLLARQDINKAEWISNNFTHPKDSTKDWSWKDHEFQIEIFSHGDDVREIATKKVAQVGLSEGSIRDAIAFTCMHKNVKAAYVLPTSGFSYEFSLTRIKPAIDNSPLVKSMLSEDTANLTVRQLGSSYLIMRGTSGDNQGVSVDLDAMYQDELNLCNIRTLELMESRMQHSKLKLKRTFSTPTVSGFGISAAYDLNSKAVRMCKCEKCSQWVEITPDCMTIPGLDTPVMLLSPREAYKPEIRNAYLACPKCRKELTIENLNNPELREWVHTDRVKQSEGYLSYHVRYWDVPTYNTTPEVIRDLAKMGKEKWTQMRIGEDYDSAENTFQVSAMYKYALDRKDLWSLDDILAGSYASCGLKTYIGCDLGKYYDHLVIGVADDRTLRIVCAVRITKKWLQSRYGEPNLDLLLTEIGSKIRLRRGVVDSMPDYSIALKLIGKNNNVWRGAVYRSKQAMGQPDIYTDKLEESDGKSLGRNSLVITVDSNFTDLCEAVNNGSCRLPDIQHDEDTEIMGEHFRSMRKVEEENKKGQLVQTWVSITLAGRESTEDHFAHAVGYCWAARASLDRGEEDVQFNLPASSFASTAKIKSMTQGSLFSNF